jgi:hypothetical protein
MMRTCKRGLVLLLVACLGAAAALPYTRAADKDKPPAKGKKPDVEPAISLAATACQLAMEGQRRRSPTLMLAAAELLGGLKEGGGNVKGVKVSVEGGKVEGDKKPLTLSVADWVEQAREFAKADKELSAFLEKRLDQLNTRGLIFSQGVDKESVNLRGTTFKVISRGVIGAGQTLTLSNVIFEANKPGMILVVGDGDGDLDLFVSSGLGGSPLGQDTDSTSTCAVSWFQGPEGPVTVRVSNVGGIAERYVVLANW